MADKLQLEVVTPVRTVLDQEVNLVTLPGVEGELGVLPGHTPLVTLLKVGEVSYRSESGAGYLVVNTGFAEVLPDRVRILTETAEFPEEIDLERAEAALDRAQKRLKDHRDPEVDFARAEQASMRAAFRVRVAARRI